MPQFEYKKVRDTYLSELELNELGQEGWELCGIKPSNCTSDIYAFYFKRRRPEMVLKQQMHNCSNVQVFFHL